MFLPLTLTALIDGITTVVLPLGCKDPDVGDAANHGIELAVVKFIA